MFGSQSQLKQVDEKVFRIFRKSFLIAEIISEVIMQKVQLFILEKINTFKSIEKLNIEIEVT